MIPLIDVKAQYAPLIPQLKERIGEVLESGRFIFGPEVEGFEREAAEFLGVPFALGVANGTDALVLSLEAMRIGRGDEVICPAFTFYATPESIARAGATPVFADIDPATMNLDPEDVAAKITPRTKAIMPVHLFGRPAPLAALAALGVPIVEDAAQAFGATGIATTGVCSTFSFFPTKNLFALGDGGLVACTDEDVAERLRMLRFHGSLDKRTHELVGTNSRLDAIQAAILRVKLRHLDRWSEGRGRNAALYHQLFEGSRVGRPHRDPRARHIYNQYVIRVPERDALREALTERGIGTEIYYPVPLHLQKCFATLGGREGDMPNSEAAAKETLALPIYPELTEDQIRYVATSVREVVDR